MMRKLVWVEMEAVLILFSASPSPSRNPSNPIAKAVFWSGELVWRALVAVLYVKERGSGMMTLH